MISEIITCDKCQQKVGNYRRYTVSKGSSFFCYIDLCEVCIGNAGQNSRRDGIAASRFLSEYFATILVGVNLESIT